MTKEVIRLSITTICIALIVLVAFYGMLVVMDMFPITQIVVAICMVGLIVLEITKKGETRK